MYKKPLILGVAIIALSMNSLAPLHAKVKPPGTVLPMHAARVLTPAYMMKHQVTPAMRIAAAKRAEAKGLRRPSLSNGPLKPNALTPNAPPDYFGAVPNYANSPLPQVDPTTHQVVAGTGIRKFVDSLPGVGAANANDLGNYIPLATPDTTTYPGSDYYVIALERYTQQLHKDLPPTQLQGYVQLNNGTDAQGHNTIVPPARPYFLGPMISAQRNRPVRVKFINMLPTGSGGNLFLPVDTTMDGAGTGPLGGTAKYTQNRATLHLHGGFTPWISDGTPHQWITPAGENTPYPKGVSVQNVPDMPDPGAGAMTFFYTNQQSARLMWVHDHTFGITRLNVYAGEAAPYELHDPTEQGLINSGTIPSAEVPLIIQDKTFVPNDQQLAAEDPTWDKSKWGGLGNLWFPHVYMPNQNPGDISGAAPMGRWDYGPWFWPPYTGLAHGPIPNPYYDPVNASWEPPTVPGTPTPSAVPEAFLDTPLVNGTAYPYLNVDRKAYRFRILNASDDRTLNLQLYYAKSSATMWNPDGTLNTADAGEVPMVAAVKTAGYPANWPTDGRDGGVPDPTAAGPQMIQIGNDGGLLPAPDPLTNQPINYGYNRRDITVLNVSTHTLMLGPAERADVVVDFSQVPAGSKLILYNDAPAPVPAFDPRYDYYTGDPDQTLQGGAPTTLPGYGPNTRTLMQFQVQAGTAAPAFDLAGLQAAVPAAYKASQPKPLVPEKAYDAALGTTTPADTYSRIQDTSLKWAGLTTPMSMQPKAIQELFDVDYGRMNSTLGTELPHTSATTQTTLPFEYIDPPTEIIKPSDLGTQVGSLNDGTQIWKITHNGVDTHAVHFHLFDVQVINRVGWDGAIRPPDPDELGWKDTVRMNPLEDIIVALRPSVPTLPFKVQDSVRPLDPTMPLGSTTQFSGLDPTTGNPVTVVNKMYDFGWEYVWHCHLLGHEENDMMRPIVFQVAPTAPASLAASLTGAAVHLTWANQATYPAATQVTIQRATDAAFTSGVTTFTTAGNATSYTDSAVTAGSTYYYRVRAENVPGYSPWSDSVSITVPAIPATPTNVRAVASGIGFGPRSINLTWAESAAPAVTGFTINWALNAAFTTGVGTRTVTPGAVRQATLTGLARATRYYIRIRADNAALSSAWAPTVNVVTP
jgi:FtsP/CotA-like multicopper oxidase with cupredoxin domain